MSHLSHKKLKPGVVRDIVDVFAKTLCSLRGRSGERFIGDLLTRTEILMLSKRLAILTLLDAGYTRYRIEKGLGVSTSTVTRLYHLHANGAFRHIQEFHARKRQREETWRMVELFLSGGLPIRGTRWKKRKRRAVPYTSL